MIIMLELSPEVEEQLCVGAAKHDAESVRRLLAALAPTQMRR